VLADELASYGPEVRVVAPDDLRAEVIRRLEATRDVHARAAAEGPNEGSKTG
jgi:proteasome accessory factor B